MSIWHAHAGWLAIPLHAQNFARWCGLGKISVQTMERWWRLWAAVYFLDSLIDGPLDDRAQAGIVFERLLKEPEFSVDELPTWAYDEVIAVVGLLRNAMRELGTQWDTLVSIGLSIRDIGHAKAQMPSLLEYTSLLHAEGRLTTELLCACMNTQERSRYRHLRRFRGAFKHLATGGIVFDHACDLPKDYRKHLTVIRPTAFRQCFIAACCAVEALRLGRYPRVALALTGVVLVDFWRNFPRLRPWCFWSNPVVQIAQLQREVLEA